VLPDILVWHCAGGNRVPERGHKSQTAEVAKTSSQLPTNSGRFLEICRMGCLPSVMR